MWQNPQETEEFLLKKSLMENFIFSAAFSSRTEDIS